MYMFRRGHSLFGKEIMWFNFCNHVTFVGRIQPVAPLKVLHIYKDFFFFFYIFMVNNYTENNDVLLFVDIKCYKIEEHESSFQFH